jgi:hypothetical protein
MGIGADGEQDDLAYVDTLPEVSCVEVIYRRKYGTTNNGT